MCNPSDILLFKKRPAERKVNANNFDPDAMGEVFDGPQITMEDLVDEYFKNIKDEKNKLKVLDVKDIGNAIRIFIDKDDKDALKHSVDKCRKKTKEALNRGDIDEIADIQDDDDYGDTKSKHITNNRAGTSRARIDFSDSDGDDIDEPVAPVTRGRGRGRGRGSRGGRGRGTTAAPSPAKRGRGRASASAASQSTLLQSFSRSDNYIIKYRRHQLISKYINKE